MYAVMINTTLDILCYFLTCKVVICRYIKLRVAVYKCI